jgi:PPOX class probable FMN-dependent enzyme
MPDDHMKASIGDEAELRALLGEPLPAIANKERLALDKHCRRFIELSPFLTIGTIGADGHLDVSPRGDPPGFVKVIDDRTIAIPERPGNRRADTLMAIMQNPKVALMFLIPGVPEVLRLSGRAEVVREPTLLTAMTVNGKAPKLAIRIAIDHVFFHCGKALTRSKMWDPGTHIKRDQYASFGEIIHDQRMSDQTPDEINARIQATYKNDLY